MDISVVSTFLSTMGNAGMNEHFCTNFCVVTCFHFFLEDIPRSTIAGSQGNYIFKILRNCRTIFYKGYTSLLFSV